MKTIYLGLGSNLGDRAGQLEDAIRRLAEAGVRVLRVSPVYETAPQDFAAQGWFLNLVAKAETELLPLSLLARISRIEREMGRRRVTAKGPRTIDIDILLYGAAVVRSARLEIPHPRLAERRFVLAPLADLAPELRHPVTRLTAREMLAAVAGQAVRRVDFTPKIPPDPAG